MTLRKRKNAENGKSGLFDQKNFTILHVVECDSENMHIKNIKTHKARISANKECAKDHFCMELEVPELGTAAVPGQFVNVQVRTNVTEQLLRIPMGIHRMSRRGISILYKVVGAGTRLLSERTKGEEIDVLGPLGNGFDLTFAGRDGNNSVVLIAGGHGAAPLYAVAEVLRKKDIPVTVLLGARTSDHLVLAEGFKGIGAKVKLSTEDGSRGHKGYVTDILKDLCATGKSKGKMPFVCACGPRPMLAAVAAVTKKSGDGAQVSLDAYMACGIGACLGCAIKTLEGYKLVCKDGPVFRAAEIDWETEGRH
jgi:dihydroorotate dehydrogenase electron transfer subunit